MATAIVELEAQIADTNAASHDEGSHHIPTNEAGEEIADAPERIIDLVADPDTVEANRKLLGALGICVVIILVQAAFNFVLYLRRPDAIVVDRTAGGDRVVVMNNREYGVTDNVRFTPDEPSVGDKKYLATHFLELYALDLPNVSGMTAYIGGTTVTTKRARASHNYRRRIRRNSAAIVRQPPVTARSLTPAPVQVIPPAQPADYLSGQARVTVRGNEDPVVRVGLAQHGPVIIEFPVADNFFAVHPGGSQVVTFDESPTLATDHYLVFRVGTNFALAAENTTVRAEARASVSVQMQSGLFVTFLFYPVKDVSRMAHRVVVMYGRDEVVAARRAAGLAVNLDNKTPPPSAAPSITSRRVNNAHHRAGSHEQSQSEDEPHTNEGRDVRSGVTLESSELATSTITTKRRFNRSINLQREAQKALREALASPTRFNRWSAPKHGLSIAALAPVDLDATRRLTVVAAKNVTPSGLRVLAGSPEIDLQTLNDAGQIVQVRSITRLHREASTLDGAIPAGATIYYVVIYETPVLDAAQRVRLSIAQINAADQPASTDVSGADQ